MADKLILSERVRNEALRYSYNVGDVYISIPTVTGAPSFASLPNVKVAFSQAASGRVQLVSSIQIAVAQGTIIDRVYISKKVLTNGDLTASNYDEIELEGNEVISYTDMAGIYLISTVNISIGKEF